VTRTTFSTCSTEALPTIVQTGREGLGEHAQALVLSAATFAPAGHPERDDLAHVAALVRRAARTAPAPWGSTREARLDHVHAELVEGVHDAHLLLGGEGHAAAAHAVAQGGVV
jgi:hypothetical protein